MASESETIVNQADMPTDLDSARRSDVKQVINMLPASVAWADRGDSASSTPREDAAKRPRRVQNKCNQQIAPLFPWSCIVFFLSVFVYAKASAIFQRATSHEAHSAAADPFSTEIDDGIKTFLQAGYGYLGNQLFSPFASGLAMSLASTLTTFASEPPEAAAREAARQVRVESLARFRQMSSEAVLAALRKGEPIPDTLRKSPLLASSAASTARLSLSQRIEMWLSRPGMLLGLPYHWNVAGLVLECFFACMLVLSLLLVYTTPAGSWSDVLEDVAAGSVHPDNIMRSFQEWKYGFGHHKRMLRSNGAVSPLRSDRSCEIEAEPGISHRSCRKCSPDATVGEVQGVKKVLDANHPFLKLVEAATSVQRVPKPDRTHHCRHCQACVLEMDHHCPWVGNVCIGRGNRKHFVLLLTYACLALMTFLVWMLPEFVQACVSITDFKQQFLYMFAWFLALALLVVLAPFTLFHYYLVANNMTTIEWCEKYSSHRKRVRPKPSSASAGDAEMKRFESNLLYGQGYYRLSEVQNDNDIARIPEPRYGWLLRASLFETSPYDTGLYKNICLVLGTNPLMWWLPVHWSVPSRPPYTFTEKFHSLKTMTIERAERRRQSPGTYMAYERVWYNMHAKGHSIPPIAAPLLKTV